MPRIAAIAGMFRLVAWKADSDRRPPAALTGCAASGGAAKPAGMLDRGGVMVDTHGYSSATEADGDCLTRRPFYFTVLINRAGR